MAQPAIAADLTPSGAQALWILHVGEFLAAGFVITMGRLTDRIGRRRLLTIGVAVYGVASMGAALSPSAELLIAARALLGVAAATIMPSSFVLGQRPGRGEPAGGRPVAVAGLPRHVGGATGPDQHRPVGDRGNDHDLRAPGDGRPRRGAAGLPRGGRLRAGGGDRVRAPPATSRRSAAGPAAVRHPGGAGEPRVDGAHDGPPSWEPTCSSLRSSRWAPVSPRPRPGWC
ncbi:MFS transporter [Egibacter rhizosphaerae]